MEAVRLRMPDEGKTSKRTEQQLAKQNEDDNNNNEQQQQSTIEDDPSGERQHTKSPNGSKSTSDDYLDRLNCELQDLSVSTSPKAKSAPATPCNTTPTIAFHQLNHQHQHHLYLNQHESQLLRGQNQAASTLPTDIRRTGLPVPLAAQSGPSSQPQLHHQHQNHQLYQNQEQQQQHHELLQQDGEQQQLQCHAAPPEMWSRQRLNELLQQGKAKLEAKDYEGAICELTKCIDMATQVEDLDFLKRRSLLGKRAEAHFALGNLTEAIEDSRAARDLNPKWTQAYYLQGRAQFLLGQSANALAAFAYGLAQEQPANQRLFGALVEAALASKLKGFDFVAKYRQLETAKLHERPLIVVAVIGQELLSIGLCEHAAIMLESALKLGPEDKRHRASVASSLAYAYSALEDYEKAAQYLQMELDFESEAEHVADQCRVLGNLGYTYYKMTNFDKSIEKHRAQINLAIKSQLFREAASALDAAGHVHAAMGNFVAALTSHSRCYELMRHFGDQDFAQFKQLLAMAHCHTMLMDFNAAVGKHAEALRLLESSPNAKLKQAGEMELRSQSGRIMVEFSLAHLALKRRSYQEARQYFQSAYDSASRITPSPPSGSRSTANGDQPSVQQQQLTRQRVLLEMRAAMGLGHAHRLLRQHEEARKWFERQLELARQAQQLLAQQQQQQQQQQQLAQQPEEAASSVINDSGSSLMLSQALCNVALSCQQLKDLTRARKLLEENLDLIEVTKQPTTMIKAYAFSYLANQCYLESDLEEARELYEKSIELFGKLSHCSGESKTLEQHVNLINEKLRQASRSLPTAALASGSGSSLDQQTVFSQSKRQPMLAHLSAA